MMRTTSSKQKRVLYAPRAIKSSSSDNCNLPVMEKDNILELPHTAALNIIMHKQYPGASRSYASSVAGDSKEGIKIARELRCLADVTCWHQASPSNKMILIANRELCTVDQQIPPIFAAIHVCFPRDLLHAHNTQSMLFDSENSQ